MPSKFDQLREGLAVEIEPGLSGKLNKENKTLQLSSGRVLDVSDDTNYFPSNEGQLSLSRQREQVEKKAKGPVGEFLHQYTSKGIPGGVLDWPAYLSQTGEEYATRKQAENQVSNRISEESPYISGAATAANIGTDIALTRGMSALKAAPLLTLGSAGSRIATDTGEVALETAGSAALGGILDKATGWLGKVAQRRGASRNIPIQQENVRNRNILGQQSVNEANALQKEEFNLFSKNVSNSNEALLHQHKLDLNARQNSMIQAENSYREAKLASESEYGAAKVAAKEKEKILDADYKLKSAQYQESLKKMPELQKKAQLEHSENVIKNASEIEKNFPRTSKISSEELRLEDFIEEGINQTGMAGSREASQASRVLRSIFPEGEIIGGRELSKKYKALEDAIQRATPEVKEILSKFKNHLGERLPSILEDSIAYGKILPLLRKSVESDIKTIMNEINFSGLGSEQSKKSISNFAIENSKNLLKSDMTPANFIQKLQSGEMAREMANKILTVEDFLVDITPQTAKKLQKQGTFDFIFQEANRKHAYFVSELENLIQKKLTRYELKALESARNSGQKFKKDIKKTHGMAEPVPEPIAPQAPEPVSFPNPPSPIPQPKTPEMPASPSLYPKPTQPSPQSFSPIPEPSLPPAQGMAETAGDFLEKPLFGGGKGITNNPLLKLGGLKYILGKAALPLEAAYAGSKVLTSPTAAGQAARMTFKQGGIQAIESWAQKYPSYNNGILENPQERRSLTKEIENDPEIPIEQKAIIQSKVNRGKNLNERL